MKQINKQFYEVLLLVELGEFRVGATDSPFNKGSVFTGQREREPIVGMCVEKPYIELAKAKVVEHANKMAQENLQQAKKKAKLLEDMQAAYWPY